MAIEILIVDDNADIRNILNELIIDAGYKTRLAAILVLYPASKINSLRIFLISELSSTIKISIAIYFKIYFYFSAIRN